LHSFGKSFIVTNWGRVRLTFWQRYVRQPCVTEAVFLFGEIAQCFGEWNRHFGHAEIVPAQSLLV
jgi:hypothetical protein